MPGLFEEGAGLADGVADRGPADLEKVGEDVHRAQSALVEDGQKDAFAVADLLVKDAAAGASLSRATAPLIAETLGLGSLPGCEPFGELLQVGAADSGQGRVGQLLDELGPRGAGIGIQERVEGLGSGEAERGPRHRCGRGLRGLHGSA